MSKFMSQSAIPAQTTTDILMKHFPKAEIYASKRWIDEFVHLTKIDSLQERAKEVNRVEGLQLGKTRKTPSLFLCLLAKCVELKLPKETMKEFVRSTEPKYLRALGAFYTRLVANCLTCFKKDMEPLSEDYRSIQLIDEEHWGGDTTLTMHQFADLLMSAESKFCSVHLPKIPAKGTCCKIQPATDTKASPFSVTKALDVMLTSADNGQIMMRPSTSTGSTRVAVMSAPSPAFANADGAQLTGSAPFHESLALGRKDQQTRRQCDRSRSPSRRRLSSLDSLVISHSSTAHVVNAAANRRLFLGGLPGSLSKPALQAKLVEKTGVTIEDIICTLAAGGKKQCCYIVYEDHALATQAFESIRNQMSCLFSKPIYVEWADEQEELSNEEMSNIREIHVSNLEKSIDKKKLQLLFKPYKPVKVCKIGSSALVEFTDPLVATNAMTEHKEKYQITLAKPRWYRDQSMELLKTQTKRRDDLLPTSNPSLSSILDGQLNLGSSVGSGGSSKSVSMKKKTFVYYNWGWAADVPCWNGSYENCRRVKKLSGGQMCAFKHE